MAEQGSKKCRSNKEQSRGAILYGGGNSNVTTIFLTFFCICGKIIHKKEGVL